MELLGVERPKTPSMVTLHDIKGPDLSDSSDSDSSSCSAGSTVVTLDALKGPALSDSSDSDSSSSSFISSSSSSSCELSLEDLYKEICKLAPKNTLDWLIKELGGEKNVAEVCDRIV